MNRKRILLIDDDPDAREIVSRVLSGDRFEVVVAANAIEGMRIANTSAVDLILLDLKMPDFDGRTILKTLTSTNADPCPIVILSGVDNPNITSELVTDGAFGFIHKPINTRTFVAQIHEILNWSAKE